MLSRALVLSFLCGCATTVDILKIEREASQQLMEMSHGACFSLPLTEYEKEVEELTPGAIQNVRRDPGGQCWNLGRTWLHRTGASIGIAWHLPVDREKARIAFLHGCELAHALSCAALVEYALVRDAEEEVKYRALAGTVRTPEEIAEEDRRLQLVADEADRGTTALREKVEEENERNRESARQAWLAGGAQLAQGAQQMAERLDSGSGGAVPSSGGESPCAPCAGHVQRMQTACGGNAQTPSCYQAAGDMHMCTANAPGCVADPSAARAEAERMYQAARDIAR